jgi:hypothetical protein
MKKTRTKIKSNHVCAEYFHRSPFELYIGKSTIMQAGDGVFSKDMILANSIIDEYYGELYNISFSPSKYYLDIDGTCGIDAFNYPRCYMAMINDAYQSTFQNNCEFIIDIQAKRAFIKAMHDIPPDTELFISYGTEYWKW